MKREKQANQLWDFRGYDFKFLNSLTDIEINSLWDTEFFYDLQFELN